MTVSKQKGSELQVSHPDSIELPKNQRWMQEFYIFESSNQENPSLTSLESEDESFNQLLKSHSNTSNFKENQVVEGIIVNIGLEYVTVDIGYKWEGIIPIEEFKTLEGSLKVEVGDRINVYLERLEADNGFLLLSKDKADLIQAKDEIYQAWEKDQIVEGKVTGAVGRGLLVDIGVKAFLPASQIDYKPVKALDLKAWIRKDVKVKIIKFDPTRGSIVLSRRAVMLQERKLTREKTIALLKKKKEEGGSVVGQVRSVKHYGVFVDLGGIHGLLRIQDIAWGKVTEADLNERFKERDSIEVKVLNFDQEKQQVSLGLKQFSSDPWIEIEKRFPIGTRVSGKVVSIKKPGAAVEIEDGVRGWISIADFSWTKEYKYPTQFLKVGDDIECQVLAIDLENRWMSLGLKQLQENPWKQLKYPVGSIVEGKVKSITDFGVFVDIGIPIYGLVYTDDISWTKKMNHPSEVFKKEDQVKAVVLEIQPEEEKFILGIKQLEKDPWESIKARYSIHQVVEGEVSRLTSFGAFVQLEEGIEGLIPTRELADQKVDNPSSIIRERQKVKAAIISISPKERKLALSIRKLGYLEEQENYLQYGREGSDMASIGNRVGDKLNRMRSILKEKND